MIEIHAEGDRLATTHAPTARCGCSFSHGVVELLHTGPDRRDSLCDDLKFDPAGALLAAAFDDGRAVVRGVDEPPGADPLLLSPAQNRMTQLAFHPGGRWLATANMAEVCLCGPSSAPATRMCCYGPVEGLAFAPDGSWLASIGVDGTVRQPLASRPAHTHASCATGAVLSRPTSGRSLCRPTVVTW